MLRFFARLMRPCALLLALSIPASAGALESHWSDSEKAQARLVIASASENKAFVRAGIEIRLQKGWHTYWRYPGDAGLPPRFDWSGSENLERAEILWPAPVRIAVEDGIQSIGYKGTVLLPVRVYPRNPDEPISLRLRMDYGVCENICIPGTAKLALTVPSGAGRSYPALDAAEARVPKSRAPGPAEPPAIVAVKLDRAARRAAVVDVAVVPGEPFDLFAEGPTNGWALPLPRRKQFGNGRAQFMIPIEGAPAGADPMPKSLRLTLVSGGRAIEVVAPLD